MEAALERAKALLSHGRDNEAAEALAPWRDASHPHVHFFAGVALQRAHQLQPARAAYERALQLEPALIFARVNLVHVLVESRRFAEAEGHATEACAREPHSAERHFLHALVLTEARKREAAIAALRRCLSIDPQKREAYVNLDALLLQEGDTAACRALARLAIREAQQSGDTFRFWAHELQRPPHVVQGLRAQPWWDTRAPELAWTAALEAHADIILAELTQLKAWGIVGGRSAHDGSLVTCGQWSEFVLLDGNGVSPLALAACPRTVALLSQVPAVTQMARCGVGEALFSALAPGTHLRPHCGSTNSRLTAHFCLVTNPGCRLRCGDELRSWEAGRCLVFDDSFEHEAWNDGDSTRIVLLCNFFHPELPREQWLPIVAPDAVRV